MTQLTVALLIHLFYLLNGCDFTVQGVLVRWVCSGVCVCVCVFEQMLSLDHVMVRSCSLSPCSNYCPFG